MVWNCELVASEGDGAQRKASLPPAPLALDPAPQPLGPTHAPCLLLWAPWPHRPVRFASHNYRTTPEYGQAFQSVLCRAMEHFMA